MSFGVPLWFWGLLVLPLLVLAFIRAERRGARRLEEFVAPRLLPELAGTVNRFRRLLKFGLVLSVLAFVLISLARPRWGYAYDETKRKGLDLILAVDTSRSMLSNDVQPNRLERVKLAAQDLINELQGDRMGLIAFAGRAFLGFVEKARSFECQRHPFGGGRYYDQLIVCPLAGRVSRA